MNVILLSTYNGGAYLRKQLDSVLSQSVADFTLLIRDDGSSDDTLDILHTYSDPRIRILTGENLGPAGSFFALLEEARKMGAEHIFFCDQDDIWMPDKLEMLLAELQSCSGPALVFSDFAMIDENDAVTGDSYAAMAKLRIPKDGDFFPKLLAQPYVFGCASVLNRELLELVKNPPSDIEMYDCWIALVASIFGTVQYLPEATIYHRFHSANATGKAGANSLAARLKRVTKQFKKQCENTALRLNQAKLLLHRYGDTIPMEQRPRLEELAKNPSARVLKKYGVARGGKLQNLFFYITARR
jgi:GT2 family glycosyltransferase